MNNKYIYIGIALIISVMSFTIYHYSNKIDMLEVLNSQHIKDNKNLSKKLEKQIKDHKDLINDINEQAKMIQDLNKKSNDYKNKYEEVINKTTPDRLSKIMNKKTSLVVKALNSGISKEVDEINELTKNKR